MMLQSCVSFSITDIAKSLVSLVFNWCFIKLLFQVVGNKTRMCKDKPKMELLLICDRFMLSTKKIRTCFRISCDSSRGKSLRYSSTESGSVRKLISCLDNFFLSINVQGSIRPAAVFLLFCRIHVTSCFSKPRNFF